MLEQQSLIVLSICLLTIPLSLAVTTTESSTVTTSEKSTTSEVFTTTESETTSSTTSQPSPSPKTSTSSTSTTSTTSTTPKPSSTSTTSTTSTTTAQPQSSTEWQDIEEEESQKLVSFVVSEIQKLKVEHKELDDCQELELSSVLSGKKLNGKTIKYSITLKVQPQVKNTEECIQQNSTMVMANMHPEICEADVTEGDRGGTDGKTLLRSTCLQVEELQD